MIEIFTSNPLSTATYGALAIAISSLWAHPSKSVWLGFAALSLGFGVAAGKVNFVGIAVLVVIGSCFHAAQQKRWPSALRWLCGAIALVGAAGLSLHLLPGFETWRVLYRHSLSEASRPLSLYLNLDKPFLGLLILGFGAPLIRSRSEWIRVAKGTVPYFVTAIAVLLGLVALLGYVRWDPKWPQLVWLWAPRNLLFACVAEEALFRGFLQTQLMAGLTRGPWMRVITARTRVQTHWIEGLSVLLAAILFGLAHYRGGPSYVVLSTVAGLFYGFAYYRTGRLEAAIGCHFAVNAVHFLLFTYPSVASP